MKAYARKSSAARGPASPTRQSKRSNHNVIAEAAVAPDAAMIDAPAAATVQRAWMGSPQRQRLATLQAMMNRSPRLKAQMQLRAMIDGSSRMIAQRQSLHRSLTAGVQRQIASKDGNPLQGRFGPLQRQGPKDDELQMKATPVAVQLRPGNVVQRVQIAGIEVNKKTNMPSWTQGEHSYHINLTTATSHVSREGSPMIHYFFEGTGTDIEDKQPTKKERGGRSKKRVKGVKGKVKTKTVFSALPNDVQAFVKTNWDAIVG